MKQDIAVEAAKASPAVAVSVMATAQGWTMSDWVAIATALYVVMQAAYLGWKWRQDYKRAEREDKWWQK